MTWGLEVAPVKGNKKRTLLTVLSKGTAKKPLWNFVMKVSGWMGAEEKSANEMTKNIERLATAK